MSFLWASPLCRDVKSTAHTRWTCTKKVWSSIWNDYTQEIEMRSCNEDDFIYILQTPVFLNTGTGIHSSQNPYSSTALMTNPLSSFKVHYCPYHLPRAIASRHRQTKSLIMREIPWDDVRNSICPAKETTPDPLYIRHIKRKVKADYAFYKMLLYHRRYQAHFLSEYSNMYRSLSIPIRSVHLQRM